MFFSLNKYLFTTILSCLSITAFADIPKNEKKNVEFLSKLANEGDAEAQFLLGLNYLENHSDKAIYWLEKAAFQDFSSAQYFLGLLYQEGQGVEKSIEKSQFWLEKSAENNNVDAQFLVGLSCYQGNIVAKDYEKAFSLFQKASSQNHSGAQYHLGIMYLCGFGTLKDEVKAAEFFEKSALSGDAHAQYELGIMLMNGEAFQKNYVAGAQWIEKSANQGKVEAQSTLGVLYQNGWGVSKNSGATLHWLSKAALQDDKKAVQNLKSMISPFLEFYGVCLPDDVRKNWDVGCYTKNAFEYIFEYVPSHENVNNWSQIFTVFFMSNEILNNDYKTAVAAMKHIKKAFTKQFGSRFKLKPLQITENDVLYEAVIPSDKTHPAEYEIVRLIRTSSGVYRISYAKKGSPIEENDKEKWLKCIQKAGLINFSRS